MLANNKRKSIQTKITDEPNLKKPNISAGNRTSLAHKRKNEDPVSEDEDFSDEEGGYRVGDIYIPPEIEPYCSSESKGNRLIITRINNYNFKSYAGEVPLGPFHHRFSSIIGPNGSGKSNVIDSMLFVFGYRANKIRCKKLSVLLHNSARFPNREECSVKIYFKEIMDKEDGTFQEIENSDFFISRTAFKDNSSYYTINNKKVQFKEVAKLLKGHGVDLDHNRFLILQGEVEQIAMMKSKSQSENEVGMLEYLEEIIGTKRYKEPLLKISSRVETLSEERTEKLNRCKLAEREMKDLELPYNDAVDYLKLENQAARSKNLEIQKRLSDEKKKLGNLNEKCETIKGELSEHDKIYDEIRKERLEKENSAKDEIQKFEKMVKDKEEKENDLKATLSNYHAIHSQMGEINKRRKQNKAQLEKNKEKLVDIEKLPEKNQKEIDECESKVTKLAKQKTAHENELQQNYAELERETNPLVEQREKIETELVELKPKFDEAKAEMTLAEKELNILNHDETTEKRKYESIKTSYSESVDGLQDKKVRLEELKVSIPDVKKEIESKTKEHHIMKTEENQIREKMMVLKAEINEKQSSMQTAKSNNKVLDTLMRQKHNGTLPGILGRLGDLGGIDAKYDVAISTACGRLDNIVVDTVNTAQACIEHLKRTDAGRASFIALEKVQNYRRHCENKIDTPENVPRLFDLVKVEDQRVLPAFYFSLRDTLVANDLDQGTRIAYGLRRYRVVTLKGDVIETSGTMSGGGRTQLKGRMGQQVTTKTKPNSSMISQKALDELQEQAGEMQSRINYCQQRQGELEKEINQLKQSLQIKEAEVNKMSITIQSLTEQLPRIKNQLEDQKRRMQKITSDPAKVAELEQKISAAKIKYEKFEKATTKLSDKISGINSKIADIHGNKVKSVQQQIDNLSKQITKLNNNVNKLKVEISTSERNYKKTEKEIEDFKNEINKAEEELTSLNQKRQDLDTKGTELTKEIEDLKEQIDNANKGNSNFKKEILALQKKESDGKLIRIEIEEKLKNIEKDIKDVKARIPRAENELKPLKLHQIPGELEPQEPFKIYNEEELNSYTKSDLDYKVSREAEELAQRKPNLSVIQEYMAKREAYLQRVQILEDITNKRNDMRNLLDDVRKRRYTEFMKGYRIIARKLKEMYQMITHGGDADLELCDSMDPFTEGIQFSVRPPKKTWKNISNLSGGEKTLSSLALVFALHYYKPSPLYFMDEIDAALDFKNISIVANYIKERTKNAQFIIISLRSNMFELSDYMIGIYKVFDCTQSIGTINDPPRFRLIMDSVDFITQNQYALEIIDDPNVDPNAENVENENNRNTNSDLMDNNLNQTNNSINEPNNEDGNVVDNQTANVTKDSQIDEYNTALVVNHILEQQQSEHSQDTEAEIENCL